MEAWSDEGTGAVASVPMPMIFFPSRTTHSSTSLLLITRRRRPESGGEANRESWRTSARISLIPAASILRRRDVFIVRILPPNFIRYNTPVNRGTKHTLTLITALIGIGIIFAFAFIAARIEIKIAPPIEETSLAEASLEN